MNYKSHLFLLFALCCTLQLPAQVDLDNGLIGWYTFTGSVKDQSDLANHGELLGGASAIDVLRIKDNAIDAASLPNNLLNGLHDFSIAFRVKFTQFRESETEATANAIMSTWSSTNQNNLNISYVKRRFVAGQVIKNTFSIYLDGEFFLFSNIELVEKTWYAVTVLREGDRLRLYLDGVQMGTGLSFPTDPLDVVVDGLIFGQEQDKLAGGFLQIQSLNGELDDLCFYKRALTNEEVAALFQGGHTPVFDYSRFNVDGIELYPNPYGTTERIQLVNSTERKIAAIRILTLEGRVIRTIVPDATTSQIQVEIPAEALALTSSCVVFVLFEDGYSAARILAKN